MYKTRIYCKIVLRASQIVRVVTEGHCKTTFYNHVGKKEKSTEGNVLADSELDCMKDMDTSKEVLQTYFAFFFVLSDMRTSH